MITHDNGSPVTQYAQEIIGGYTTAGPSVHASAVRHMNDLDRPDIVYVPDLAQHIFDFFQHGLVHVNGDKVGEPFILDPWEVFVLGSIFGWYWKDSGKRRFNWSYVETGKGSGKTPMCAGLTLYMIGADDEPMPEAYIIGEVYKQAQYSLQYSVDIVQSSHYSHFYKHKGGDEASELRCLRTKGKALPLASLSDAKGRSGFRPNFVLCEEYHEHSSSDMLVNLTAGVKNRPNPLSFIVTNSGIDPVNSPCGREHTKAKAIARGDIENDRYFSYVCELSKGGREKFFVDPEVWYEANPALQHGGPPGIDYVRNRIEDSRGDQELEADILRRNGCVWTESKSPWLPDGTWAQAEVKEEDVEEKILDCMLYARCVASVDLSQTTDLSSVCAGWDLRTAPDYEEWMPWMVAQAWFWMPEDRVSIMSKKDNVPYDLWRDKGFLFTSKEKIIDTMDIVDKILEIFHKYPCFSGIPYDRFRIVEFKKDLKNAGAEVTVGDRFAPQIVIFPHTQGLQTASPAKEEEGGLQLWMTNSIENLQRLLLESHIMVVHNPILRWCMNSVVLEKGKTGNKCFDKAKSTARIDGAVTLAMAAGALSAFHRLDGEDSQQGAIIDVQEAFSKFEQEGL